MQGENSLLVHDTPWGPDQKWLLVELKKASESQEGIPSWVMLHTMP